MPDGVVVTGQAVSLGAGRKGLRGRIVAIDSGALAADAALPAAELERRLLEMGFVEGARVEILHEGFMGRDPIAVRVDDATIALRRREAVGILIETLG
jgi:ferrous iron transport protein A